MNVYGRSRAMILVLVACASFACGENTRDTNSTNNTKTNPTVPSDAGSNNSLDSSPEMDAGQVQDAGQTQDAAVAQDASTSTGDVVEFLDLAYTPPPGVQSSLATLDIFRTDDGQTRPLVLLVHGGSWVGGDKEGYRSRIAPWFVNRGYVAAPVNFRLATTPRQTPEVKPQDQARDIAAALAWLMTNAEQYQIETENVLLVGYSSGAHLVALLATDERYLQNAGLDENLVTASISLDVHVYDVPFALEKMVGSVREDKIPVIRHLFGQSEMQQLDGSPSNYLDGWAARQLIISVDQDPNMEGSYGYLVSQTGQRYVNALKQAGHQAIHVHDVTENHASLTTGFGAPGDVATQAIADFLAE